MIASLSNVEPGALVLLVPFFLRWVGGGLVGAAGGPEPRASSPTPGLHTPVTCHITCPLPPLKLPVHWVHVLGVAHTLQVRQDPTPGCASPAAT